MNLAELEALAAFAKKHNVVSVTTTADGGVTLTFFGHAPDEAPKDATVNLLDKEKKRGKDGLTAAEQREAYGAVFDAEE